MYSYRNKNTINVIEKMLENADHNITIRLIDQSPLHREKKTDELEAKYPTSFIAYQHVFWDYIYSPIQYKAVGVQEVADGFDYVALVGDDVEFTPHWDERLINFVSSVSAEAVVSGRGKLKLSTGKYMLETAYEDSKDFNLAQYISRDLVFGRTATIKDLHFDHQIKYFGEQELMSFQFLFKGIPIYSAPSDIYNDLGSKTVENTYCPFSIQHNYNSVLERIQAENPEPGIPELFSYHNLDRFAMKKIPYQVDDVLYDPHSLKFNDMGGERFLGIAKAIY